MIIRNKIGQFSSVKKLILRAVLYIWILVGIVACLAFLSEKYVNYRLSKQWIWNFPIEVRFHKILNIVDRPATVVVSPIIKQIELGDIETKNPIDAKIYELWGERHYLLARSVFKCESGLRAEAVSWDSKDIGIAQINFPIWAEAIKEKFGYTMVDLFDPMKNLEVAYWIWDRADGIEGDGRGSFEPWVVYNTGAFMGCMEDK